MKKVITICTVVTMMAFITSTAYAVPPPLPSDNFNDNSMDTTLWILAEDDHSNAWLDETSARLEMRSTASADEVKAYYAPNNWGLLPTSDFSFNIDFHYDSTSGTNANVYLGFGKSEDDYANIIAGYDGTGAYLNYQLEVNGFRINDVVKARGSTDGTLYISYDASEDDLYLSDIGYGAGDAWATLDNIVQGTWGSDIGPFFGGWSEATALASGEAYLDNFTVDSGTVVPEPATVALLGLGSLALLIKRR